MLENFADTTENEVILFTSPFNFNLQLDVDQVDFASWEQMYGPQQSNGDQHTRTMRYNFSDEASYAQPGFYISGHGSLAQEAPAEPPFKAENIIMVCAPLPRVASADSQSSMTACALQRVPFSPSCSRTREVFAVSSLVAKPKRDQCRQSGALKAPSLSNGTISESGHRWCICMCSIGPQGNVLTRLPFSLGSPEQQAKWNQTALGRTAFATQIFKRSASFGDRAAGGINLRDNLRRGDPSQTPLEFIYEAADCRMFYTAEMINDVSKVWKGAANRMFGGEQGMLLCVDGSTGHKSSISGGGQWRSGEIPLAPKDSAAPRRAAGKVTIPLVLNTVLSVMLTFGFVL